MNSCCPDIGHEYKLRRRLREMTGCDLGDAIRALEGTANLPDDVRLASAVEYLRKHMRMR